MTTINQFADLPSQFVPYLVRNRALAEVDYAFNQPLCSLQDDLFTDQRQIFLFKRAQKNGDSLPDSHLYEVLKAAKIYQYIHENGYQNDVVVVEKGIYWSNRDKEFYVVSKRLNLSNEVCGCSSFLKEEIQKSPMLEGQERCLVQGFKRRYLTVTQARALAELATIGYRGITFNNLLYTRQGQVAILDTEPLNREVRKAQCTWENFLFCDKEALRAKQAIVDIAQLKSLCVHVKALDAVDRVEKWHVIWSIYTVVVKMVLLVLFWQDGIARAIQLAPLSEQAKLVLRVSLQIPLIIKGTTLFLEIPQMLHLWSLSRQGWEGFKKLQAKQLCGEF